MVPQTFPDTTFRCSSKFSPFIDSRLKFYSSYEVTYKRYNSDFLVLWLNSSKYFLE